MTQRLKVLISAYACQPNRGSEPGVGWNVARQMAKYHEVWALTLLENRPMIEAHLSKHHEEHLHFCYVNLPRWQRGWTWEGLAAQLHYYLWQIWAFFVAFRLHRKIAFDLVHHVTYGKYWAPSFVSLLPTPFIWGVVGGGECAPKTFWREFSMRGIIFEIARDVARWAGEHDPFVRLTVRRSFLSMATTEDTAARLAHLGAKRIEIVLKCPLEEGDVKSLGELPTCDDMPIRFISIGRLLHLKGFHLGLRAFAKANLPQSEYWIVGDGPEREHLKALAAQLHIADQVIFWGGHSRSEVFAKLGACHILVHPTLHDSAGWVILEAMAASRPVICLDLGGPALQVTESTGFKISAQTPDQAVDHIGEAMVKLAENPGLRRCMGKNARKRVIEKFTAKHRGILLNSFYKEAHQSTLELLQSLPPSSANPKNTSKNR